MADQIDISVPSIGFPIGNVPPDYSSKVTHDLGINIQQQTQLVSNAVLNQYQLTQDHNAILDFYSKHAQLEDMVSNVKDPKEKYEAYRNGLNALIYSVHENYPNMSEDANSEMAKSIISKSSSAHLGMLKQLEEQNQINLSSYLTNASHHAAEAETPEDSQAIETSGIKYIGSMVENGTISSQVGETLTHKLVHNVALGKMQRLVDISPQDVSKVSHEESKLPWKMYRQLQNTARKKLEERDNEVKKQKEKESRQLNEDVSSGKYNDNPTIIYDMYLARKISKETYETALHHRPTNTELLHVVDEYIDNHHWESKKELNDYFYNDPGINTQLESSDYRSVRERVEEKRKMFDDEQSLHAEEQRASFRSNLTSRLGLSLRYPDIKEKAHGLFKRLDKQLKFAKDIESQDKIMESFRKQMDTQFPKYDPMFNPTGKQIDKALVDAFQKENQ